MMEIYLAGRFDDLEELRGVRGMIQDRGHTVTASWLDEEPKPDATPLESFLRSIAVADIGDVRASNCFVLYTKFPVGERGGRENEFGLVMDKPYVIKVIVGPCRTAFHRLADLRFDDWNGFFAWLPGVKGNMEACLEAANYGKAEK